jgi:hypothetical protein
VLDGERKVNKLSFMLRPHWNGLQHAWGRQMFRNIRNYMGRPILTKQLLNTTPPPKKILLIPFRVTLFCGVGFRQQFSCVWSLRVKYIRNETPTNCVNKRKTAFITLYSFNGLFKLQKYGQQYLY